MYVLILCCLVFLCLWVNGSECSLNVSSVLKFFCFFCFYIISCSREKERKRARDKGRDKETERKREREKGLQYKGGTSEKDSRDEWIDRETFKILDFPHTLINTRS